MAYELAISVYYDVKYLEMAFNSVKKHNEMKNSKPECTCREPIPQTPERGLAFFIEGKFSKLTYKHFLKDQKQRYMGIKRKIFSYPSYYEQKKISS